MIFSRRIKLSNLFSADSSFLLELHPSAASEK